MKSIKSLFRKKSNKKPIMSMEGIIACPRCGYKISDSKSLTQLSSAVMDSPTKAIDLGCPECKHIFELRAFEMPPLG